MHFVDHIFVLLLFVVQPIHGAIAYRRYVARVKAGEKSDPARLYLQTIALEWVALAVLSSAWYLLGRPIADLGFVSPGGIGYWIGALVLAAFTGVLIYAWRRSQTLTQEEKDKQIESLGDLVYFLPRTDRDYRHFVAVSITAGIVEEILYRGFAFWYLAQFMPIWVVILVSSIAFGIGHSYQGVGGMIRVSLIGLAFGIFYVATGSIWLPMLAHAILDVLQGGSIMEVLRKNDEKTEQLVEA
jgi:membrane protease YdiL (CAAX protease family)